MQLFTHLSSIEIYTVFDSVHNESKTSMICNVGPVPLGGGMRGEYKKQFPFFFVRIVKYFEHLLKEEPGWLTLWKIQQYVIFVHKKLLLGLNVTLEFSLQHYYVIKYDWLREPRDHVVTSSFKPASLNPKTASSTKF